MSVRPALSTEEWATQQRRGNEAQIYHSGSPGNDLELVLDGEGMYPNTYRIAEARRHSVAAKCLHGQPFGFTWADVDLIRGQIIRSGREYGQNPQLYALADRIAALQPPNDETGLTRRVEWSQQQDPTTWEEQP